MAKDHEIVFEDLRGSPEKESATVDLDAEGREKGVERFVLDDDDDKTRVIDLDGDGDDDEGKGKGKGKEEPGSRGREVKSGEEAGDGDDDAEARKIKDKIRRATRKADTESTRANFWEQKARDAHKQLKEHLKRNATVTVERVDKELDLTRKSLEKAHEDGNTKEVVRLTDRLSDLKAEKITAQYEEPDDSELEFTDTGKKSGDHGKVQPSSKREELVSDWMGDNDDWYGRKGFEKATRTTNRIDKEVFAEGYDPGTEEYYDELSARIKEALPDLFDGDTGKDGNDDHSRERKRGRKRSPVAPSRGAESSTSRKSSSSRVELNEQDFETMRRFNLDTNDPDVLKEFARNKREAEQSADRQ